MSFVVNLCLIISRYCSACKHRGIRVWGFSWGGGGLGGGNVVGDRQLVAEPLVYTDLCVTAICNCNA